MCPHVSGLLFSDMSHVLKFLEPPKIEPAAGDLTFSNDLVRDLSYSNHKKITDSHTSLLSYLYVSPSPHTYGLISVSLQLGEKLGQVQDSGNSICYYKPKIGCFFRVMC
jgi:hypothetical protein